MALLLIGIFYNGNESSLLPSLEEPYTVSSEGEEESKEDVFWILYGKHGIIIVYIVIIVNTIIIISSIIISGEKKELLLCLYSNR